MNHKIGMHHTRRIHFVGIGGVGMSGIAEILFHQGYEISGSDKHLNPTTERLVSLGLEVFEGHSADNVSNADVVVVSSAIDEKNPEIIEAKQRRIPIIPRAQMLAELMRFRFGIAIAGTHGKTTTTSLMASVLVEGDLDPTFVIGGKLTRVGSNAYMGESQYLVAEADESDASFLHLNPVISVVTNVDADHLDNYEGQFERVKDTFVEFLHQLPFYGIATLCIDDPGIKDILPRIQRPMVTYGFHDGADLQIIAYRQEGLRSTFSVKHKDQVSEFTLNMPGRHNVLNATAVIGVARELNVPDEKIAKGLEEFQGVGRRFQYYGEFTLPQGSIAWVDDYGHHPNEVHATFLAARNTWPDRRIVLVFQPHRYTRTRDLFNDFCHVLSIADQLVLLDVYPAGEAEIESANGRALADAIESRGAAHPLFVPTLDGLDDALANILQDGDVVLTLGAGSIGAKSHAIASNQLSSLIKIGAKAV